MPTSCAAPSATSCSSAGGLCARAGAVRRRRWRRRECGSAGGMRACPLGTLRPPALTPLNAMQCHAGRSCAGSSTPTTTPTWPPCGARRPGEVSGAGQLQRGAPCWPTRCAQRLTFSPTHAPLLLVPRRRAGAGSGGARAAAPGQRVHAGVLLQHNAPRGGLTSTIRRSPLSARRSAPLPPSPARDRSPACLQRSQQLVLVSRYGEEHGPAADVPLLFHGAGHYDLLVRSAGSQQQPRSRL